MSAAAALPLRAGRARCPSSSWHRSCCRLEMARVVDAGHDEATVAFLDDGDRGVLDPKREQAMVRPADHTMQRDLDDTAVGDHQNVTVRMAGEDRIQLAIDACLERHRALTAGDHVPARLFSPQGPLRWETLGELFGREAFPRTEVDLSQAHRRTWSRSHSLADRIGRLESPLEVARVEAGQGPVSQPSSHMHCLPAAFRGKRGVELALDAVLAIPGRLAVPDQQ